MAQKESFFTGPIDKTPYSGCAWVAVTVTVCFLVAVTCLWHLSGFLKSHNLLQFSLPNLPSSNSNLIEQVQQVSQPTLPSTQSIQDAAQKKAEDAIKQEADKQVQEQLNTVKDQVKP